MEGEMAARATSQDRATLAQGKELARRNALMKSPEQHSKQVTKEETNHESKEITWQSTH